MTLTTRMKAIAARASPRSPYICLQCQRQASTVVRRATPRLQTSLPPRRSASTVPFSERIRRKIWGTDAPPGQDNPYGAPGSFEQQRNERLGRQNEQDPPDEDNTRQPAIVEQPQEALDSEGNDATTWEGMRVIGGADYGLETWDSEHQFEGLDLTVVELFMTADALL